MRIHKLTPIIVLLVVLAVITAILVRFRSVEAQQDRAARTPITAKATLQQTEVGGGINPSPGPETKLDTQTDLYLDADEVERRAREEQTTGATAAAAAVSPVPVSFKDVVLPLQGGIDHAVAGVATRNSGQGVIRLRGVPPGSQLLSAVLVWGEIAAPPAVAGYNVGFGRDCAVAANVVGAALPAAPQPCWNPAGQFFAYIANVTAQIAPGINGDYRISGLRSAIRDGRCPWGDGNCPPINNTLPLSEGASLIVFYANQCIPRKAQLYVNVGPQMFSGPHSVTHFTLPPIAGGLPNLKHSRIGADGQVGLSNCGLRAFTPLSDERTWIENPVVAANSVQIKGDVGGLNRDSDWNGYDGEPLNKLWDSHTDVFADSDFLAKGGGLNYRVRYLSQGDCVVWVVHILGVR